MVHRLKMKNKLICKVKVHSFSGRLQFLEGFTNSIISCVHLGYSLFANAN